VKEQFLIGCCYYPEHWDACAMEMDIARIKDLGFNTVRMGEFSWSMYEKEEGKYDFSLLQEAVRLAQEAGIYVILGTPTAAPPKWLTDRYPEVLCQSADGKRMHHGSRQQHNHTSGVYLQHCAKITEAMVKAFCGFSNVIGWQIDNELNCHREESFSEADDEAFRKWLENRYTTIDRLNDAWGTKFWSLTFNSFSQIECPRITPTHKNPSVMTDYYRFLSDSVIDYAAVQAKIIRRYMPQAFITHNGYFGNIDYKKLTDTCLDMLSFDSYPAFQEKLAVAAGRKVEYRLAQTRGCSDRYLILEQQSGPGGQLSYLLPTPLPGQIRLWTYQSIAHGATGVLYFRYRTALYGAEQLWYGIYDHDGEENHRSREVRQITQELRRVGTLFLKHRIHPQVAIYKDYDNICCDRAEPFFADDCREIFNTLSSKNIAVDMISSPEELSKYKVVIFPHIAIADELLRMRIKQFTDGGGIAVLSARSGVKDRNAQYRPMKYPGVFRETAGCCVDWFTAIPAHGTQAVEMDGKTYPVHLYYEVLEPETGVAAGSYTEGFGRGKTAIVKNGNVYYLGFYCRNDGQIYYDIIRRHIQVPTLISKDLEEVALGAYTMYLNHGDSAVTFSGFDYLKECSFTQIPPYGVVLVKQDQL